MRLIDADEVQKIINHIRGKYVNRQPKPNQLFWDTIRYIEKKVRSIPTVEAKEVVHGEWVRTKFASEYICSNCQALTYAELTRTGYKNFNFCPNCGCDMRTSAE